MNLVHLLNEQLKLGLVSESKIIFFNIMTALNKSNALKNKRKKIQLQWMLQDSNKPKLLFHSVKRLERLPVCLPVCTHSLRSVDFHSFLFICLLIENSHT